MANKNKYKTNLMFQSPLHRACAFCLCRVILANAGFEEGSSANDEILRPEHPKPQFQRDSWKNLNGVWDFAFDFELQGRQSGFADRPTQWEKQIKVPFCPESELSGIGYTDFIPAAWYHRTFDMPDAWQTDRVFLHFGGVDYESQIWVNGTMVGHHYGGAVSFSIDITESLVQGENELFVYVQDDIDSGVQPLGKQSRQKVPAGIHYTRVTGIWQTVWLEARPQSYIESVQVLPNLDDSRFVLIPFIHRYHKNLKFRVTLRSENGEILDRVLASSSGQPVILEVENPRPWGPEDPYLYTFEYELLENQKSMDLVTSYAGLRKVHVEGNRIFLNNEPVFLRLALDQGYYPDGAWTAPSDEALKQDIEIALAVGFNGARLHQKVFEERFHYWADRLGYLTWAEFPDWGLGIVHDIDAPVSLLGVANHQREWREAVLRDRNHPSIIVWTPYNETGDGARQNLELHRKAIQNAADLTRALDPTRPVCDVSGHSHVDPDIYAVHDYENDADVFGKRMSAVDVSMPESAWHSDIDIQSPYVGQPYIVAEYGGTFWETDYPKRAVVRNPHLQNWAHGKSKKDFLKHLDRLTSVLLDNPHIAGYCYTQLYDVEGETNGIYTYDRELKFSKRALKKIFTVPAAMEAD